VAESHKITTLMVYLTRVEHFNAAHKLFNPDWTDEQNYATFGKCSNPNWHGHNYELHVTVKGSPQPQTGYVFNAKILSDIIKRDILDHVDHKNLNLDVPFMQGLHTSAENLCMCIFNILKESLSNFPEVILHSVKLYETPRIYVEYFGE